MPLVCLKGCTALRLQITNYQKLHKGHIGKQEASSTNYQKQVAHSILG